MLGKPLSNKGDAGATTHDRERCQTGRRYPVAFGQFVDGGDDAVQRRPNQIFDFIPGQPDVGAIPPKFDEQLGRGISRQPLLG